VPWSDAGVLPPASQDLVFSQAVLEHVDALPDAYRAMRRALARAFSDMPEQDRRTAGTYVLADVAPKGLGAPAETGSGKL
jgi:hypothetical protein